MEVGAVALLLSDVVQRNALHKAEAKPAQQQAAQSEHRAVPPHCSDHSSMTLLLTV
jgi:hypothetical protein